jgi:hypothetical protein
VYVVSSQLFSHPVIDRVDAFRENEQLQGRNDEAEAKAAAARQDAAAAEQRARLAAEAEAAAAAAKQAAEQAAEESAAASASAAVASGAEYLLAIENVPAREWWSSCERTSTLLRRLRQTSASSSFFEVGCAWRVWPREQISESGSPRTTQWSRRWRSGCRRRSRRCRTRRRRSSPRAYAMASTETVTAS